MASPQMIYEWAQKCTVLPNNRRWSASNRQHTAWGENQKYISEHKKNAHNNETHKVNTDASESEWGKLIEKTSLEYFDLQKAPCGRL